MHVQNYRTYIPSPRSSGIFQDENCENISSSLNIFARIKLSFSEESLKHQPTEHSNLNLSVKRYAFISRYPVYPAQGASKWYTNALSTSTFVANFVATQQAIYMEYIIQYRDLYYVYNNDMPLHELTILY